MPKRLGTKLQTAVLRRTLKKRFASTEVSLADPQPKVHLQGKTATCGVEELQKQQKFTIEAWLRKGYWRFRATTGWDRFLGTVPCSTVMATDLQSIAAEAVSILLQVNRWWGCWPANWRFWIGWNVQLVMWKGPCHVARQVAQPPVLMDCGDQNGYRPHVQAWIPLGPKKKPWVGRKAAMSLSLLNQLHPILTDFDYSFIGNLGFNFWVSPLIRLTLKSQKTPVGPSWPPHRGGKHAVGCGKINLGTSSVKRVVHPTVRLRPRSHRKIHGAC